MNNDQESLSSNPFLMKKMITDYNESYNRERLDLELWETEMKRKDKELSSSSNNEKEWGYDDERNRELIRNKADEEKEKGNTFVKQGKWDEAIAHYTNAIECYDDCTYTANRALCFLKTNRFQEAESDCTISIKLDPKYVKAYLRRAAARLKLDKVEEARSDLDTVLKLEPKNSEARRYLVDLKKESVSDAKKKCTRQDGKEEVDKAMVDAEKEKKKESVSGAKKKCTRHDGKEVDKAMGTRHDGKEDVDKAMADAEKEKGNMFVKQGEWNKAITHYSNAIERYPKDSTFFANRALCYLKTYRFQEAESDCSRSLSLDSNYVKAYLRRAAARIELKKIDEARSDLNSVLKFEPNNLEARKYLSNLKPSKSIEVISTNDSGFDSKKSDITDSKKSQQAKFPPDTLNHIENGRLLGDDSVKRTPLSPRNCKSAIVKNESKSTEKRTVVCNKMYPPPKNSFQFISAWNDLKWNPKDAFLYLKQINGSQLPKILQNSLESGILSSIISILSTEFISNEISVLKYLEGLREVPRFDIIALLMSKQDKEGIEKIVQFTSNRNEITKDQAVEFRRIFQLSR